MGILGTGASCCHLLGFGYSPQEREQQCLIQILVVVTILALLVLPDCADAEPGYEVHPAGTEFIFPVKHRGALPPQHRGDYVAAVSANDRQAVKFSVETPSSVTEYSTVGHVSSRRIEATFGAMGRINVRLHLIPRPTDPPHKGRCIGRAPLYKEGTYSGMIEFAPIGKVPMISVKRGHASFTHHFRQVCKQEHPSSIIDSGNKLKRKIEVGFLRVDGKDEGRTTFLEALDFALKRTPEHSGGSLAVETYEVREGVQITRRINTAIDHDSFAMSRRGYTPEAVEINLPKPFVGNAVYSRSLGSSPSWTGNLSVDFPGGVRIPLTGPGFSAVLCRSFSVAGLNRCLKKTLPTPALGSVGGTTGRPTPADRASRD